MVALSVIVPVYGQWPLVPRLLEALAQQSLAESAFEVLLVNNLCPNYVEPASLPANARVLECATPGSYAARNRGVAEATGQWLVFTDADCQPEPQWLETLYQAIQSYEARPDRTGPPVLAGAIAMAAGDHPNPFEVYDLLRGIPQERYVQQGYAVTANLCVRRDVAQRQPFDESRYSGGDAAFTRALVQLGYPLRFVPKAVVKHPARQSWLAICTKVRRIKGGQLTAGTARQRWLWGVRTLLPPVRALWIYASKTPFPWRFRLVASVLELGLWWVGILELLRLVALRKTPERS